VGVDTMCILNWFKRFICKEETKETAEMISSKQVDLRTTLIELERELKYLLCIDSELNIIAEKEWKRLANIYGPFINKETPQQYLNSRLSEVKEEISKIKCKLFDQQNGDKHD
jgi:hypothetical protein